MVELLCFAAGAVVAVALVRLFSRPGATPPSGSAPPVAPPSSPVGAAPSQQTPQSPDRRGIDAVGGSAAPAAVAPTTTPSATALPEATTATTTLDCDGTATDWDDPPSPVPIDVTADEAVSAMVSAMGSDLASLASGIHGAAEMLLDAIGDPEQLQRHASDLWAGVNRLQRFGRKLVAFAPGTECRALALGPTDILAVVREFQNEQRESSMGSIEIDLELSKDLPAAITHPDALADALRFSLEGLLNLEPMAQYIYLGVTPAFDDESCFLQLAMRISTAGSRPPRFAAERLELGYRAARHVMGQAGGIVALRHAVGIDTTIYFTLTATSDAPMSCATPRRAGTPSAHCYGGVLVLEADPILRSVIATELRLAGRSFSTCADGASARALLEATPERFELVIAERDARLLPGHELVSGALDQFPDLKALLIQDGLETTPSALRDSSRCAVIAKPFRAEDLRTSLLDLLHG